MRYYKLILSDPDTGNVFVPSANPWNGFDRVRPGANVATWVSHLPTAAGPLRYNPGCAQVEFNIPVAPFSTAQKGSMIRVWGVGVQAVGFASDLSLLNFQLFGGMQQGIAGQYGLAKPQQAGLLAQGQILQAFGNWDGTEQTIDLICAPANVEPENGAIIFTWVPGQSLQDALTQTFANSYPSYTPAFNISPSLQTVGPIAHAAYPPDALESFSSWLENLTQPQGQALGFSLQAAVTTPIPSPLDDTFYAGVQIALQGPNTLQVWDSASFAQKPPVQLQFEDLIGQPTWISPNQLTFKAVLRADILLGDDVLFPKNLIPPYGLLSPAAVTPGVSPPPRASTVFKGRFNIAEVHHYANYRQPDASSWNTTFVANLYQQDD